MLLLLMLLLNVVDVDVLNVVDVDVVKCCDVDVVNVDEMLWC